MRVEGKSITAEEYERYLAEAKRLRSQHLASLCGRLCRLPWGMVRKLISKRAATRPQGPAIRT